MAQETHLAKDDSLINKIVYQYDPKGKQIGYSVFDASGKFNLRHRFPGADGLLQAS
jgi:hypothetical protein